VPPVLRPPAAPAVIAVSHFRTSEAGDALVTARPALAALAGCPGFLRGRAARATDDPKSLVLVSEWDGVGSYRRALSSYDVRVLLIPLLADTADEPSAFEVLLSDDGDNAGARARPSELAADADRVSLGSAAAPQVPGQA